MKTKTLVNTNSSVKTLNSVDVCIDRLLAEDPEFFAVLENPPNAGLQRGEGVPHSQDIHIDYPAFSFCRGIDREAAFKNMRQENSGLNMNRRALATMVDQNARIEHIGNVWTIRNLTLLFK